MSSAKCQEAPIMSQLADGGSRFMSFPYDLDELHPPNNPLSEKRIFQLVTICINDIAVFLQPL